MAQAIETQSYKNPPKLRDGFYDTWKKEVAIWQLITELKPEKQGPAVFLSLQPTSKARETVLANVTSSVMSSATGVTGILNAFDKHFELDKDQDAFTTFDRLIKFRRPSTMAMQEFLIEFNLLLSKAKANHMELKDGVLAYFLLSCANLPEDKEALCRATCTTLDFDSMKKQIERIAAIETAGGNKSIKK